MTTDQDSDGESYESIIRAYHAARDRYRHSKEAEAAALESLATYERKAAAARARVAELEAKQAESDAITDFATRRPDVMDRISPALADLLLLRARFPGLSPAEQFAAAGMTPADLGLLDSDVQHLALIPRGGVS
ncbi:hypothetical protein [Streptomyces sp. NPDC002403]